MAQLLGAMWEAPQGRAGQAKGTVGRRLMTAELQCTGHTMFALASDLQAAPPHPAVTCVKGTAECTR